MYPLGPLLFLLGACATLVAGSPTPQADLAPCEPSKLPYNSFGSFRLRVSNAAVPEIHRQEIAFNEKDGGGDHTLFLSSPPTTYLTRFILRDNQLYHLAFDILTPLETYLIISNQTPSADGTTKLYFSQRTGNKRLSLDGWRKCGGLLDWELRTRKGEGQVCVKKNGKRWEVRYSPEGNVKDVNGECVPVALEVDFGFAVTEEGV